MHTDRWTNKYALHTHDRIVNYVWLDPRNNSKKHVQVVTRLGITQLQYINQ